MDIRVFLKYYFRLIFEKIDFLAIFRVISGPFLGGNVKLALMAISHKKWKTNCIFLKGAKKSSGASSSMGVFKTGNTQACGFSRRETSKTKYYPSNAQRELPGGLARAG